jgi:succinoglycan biosynthesis protein ExoA
MPIVSVVVPCYNEESTIPLLLEALYQQTYPRENMEVVVADGLSSDGTRQEIYRFQLAHPGLIVKLVDNNKRIIPAALNAAIAAAEGQIIVRLDAHSIPCREYIERSVSALEEGLGQNVGGVWEILPSEKGWISRSIAVAAAHPLGVGDAHYRYTAKAQKVDTVPFGAFHRSLLQRIGVFDETLQSNEDYEFNARVRQSGGVVWLDPAIRSTYFSRSSLKALARQYWRYGYWKARMLSRYPDTLRWRQAIPPLFVLSIAGLGMLVPWLRAARFLLGLELAIYLLVLLIAALEAAIKKKDAGLLVGLPVAIIVMHFSWGAALLWSFITLKVKFLKANV